MYLGQVGYGVAMLFTLGFCGIAQLLDLVLLPDAVKAANDGLVPEADAVSGSAQALPSVRQAPAASPRSSQAADPELDALLRAAKESVKRTQQQFGD